MYLPLYSMDAFQELHMQLGDSFEKVTRTTDNNFSRAVFSK